MISSYTMTLPRTPHRLTLNTAEKAQSVLLRGIVAANAIMSSSVLPINFRGVYVDKEATLKKILTYGLKEALYYYSTDSNGGRAKIHGFTVLLAA